MNPDIAYEIIRTTHRERIHRAAAERLAGSVPRRTRTVRLGRYRLVIERPQPRAPTTA